MPEVDMMYMELLIERNRLLQIYDDAVENYSRCWTAAAYVDKHGHVTDTVTEIILFRESIEEQIKDVERALDYLERYCL